MRNFDESPKRREQETIENEAELIPFKKDRTTQSSSVRDKAFAAEDQNNIREQWMQIQGRFVDEPRAAVRDADKLIKTCMDRVSERFTSQRSHLESQLSRETQSSTEDLRIALQEYRGLLDRLLSF
jgi:hypothetical protein